MNTTWLESAFSSVLRSLRSSSVAAVFIGTLAAASLFGQPGENTLACADRPPVKYAVVVDLSTSLNGASLSRQTIASYQTLFSLLLTSLCEGDEIHIYNFPDDESSNLARIRTGEERLDFHSLLVVADSLSNMQRGATDLRHVLLRIEDQLVENKRADVVFLLTDGSLYPYAPRRRASPSAYAAEAKLFLDVSRRLSRDPQFPLYVIGIGARTAFAIDRDAMKAWRVPLPDTLRVIGYPSTFNLAKASGDALLRLAFGPRYAPVDSASLTQWIFSESDSWLQRARGYESVSRSGVRYLESVTVGHLIYTLSAGPERDDPCGIMRQRNGIDHFIIDMHERKACSVAFPSKEELRLITQALSRDTSGFHAAYLPDPSIDLRFIADTVYAMHQLVIGSRGSDCENVVLNHVRGGHAWPRPRAVTGRVDLIPAGHSAPARRIPMVPLSGGCSVVLLDSAARTLEQGSWLAIFSTGDKSAMKQVVARRGTAAEHQVSVRMGGFPFLAGSRAARVSGCIQLPRETDAAVHDMVARVVVPGNELLFEPGRAPHCSALGDDYSAWGVSHIAVTRGNFDTGYMIYGPRTDSLGTSGESEWYPRALPQPGAFFLSRLWLIAVFALGFVSEVLRRMYKVRRLGGAPVHRSWWSLCREYVGAGIHVGLIVVIFVQVGFWALDTDWWRIDAVRLDLLAEIALQIALITATQVFSRPASVRPAHIPPR